LGDGVYDYLGIVAYFWPFTEPNSGTSWYRAIGCYGTEVSHYNFNDKLGGFSVRCVKDSTILNTAPTAFFNIDPTTGTTETVFNFNASGCSDAQDPTAKLRVRWDWENDGKWDTTLSTEKTATHQYTTIGSKTIKLEVVDTGGLKGNITHEITVIPTTLTDNDGNVYKIVKIGDQWWTAQNLKVTHYRNGDALPIVTNNTQWANLTTGACCSFGNNEANVATYGRLYNWYAASDSRNIAPEGWHVPSMAEWQQLEMYLGMSQADANKTGWRGTNEGGKLKEAGTAHWGGPNTGATNESGFTALPGGLRNDDDGLCGNMTSYGYYWTRTTDNSGFSWNYVLRFDNSDVCRVAISNKRGFSLRLVKD
jgi:uncharacterized protein (TIGR02145 family)